MQRGSILKAGSIRYARETKWRSNPGMKLVTTSSTMRDPVKDPLGQQGAVKSETLVYQNVGVRSGP